MTKRAYYLEWISGYKAAKAGDPKEVNPHPVGSPEWKNWLHGWCDYHEERSER